MSSRPVDQSVLPGLSLVAGATAIALLVHELVPAVSALVVAVVLGAVIGNAGFVTLDRQAGFTFAAKRLLRIGVVLLGLRLSLTQLGELGLSGLAVVALTVAFTFFGVQFLGRRMGLSVDLSLLVATGYAICGASAIAAVEDATNADEEELAMSIGLVTLFGTLAMFVIPALADLLGMSAIEMGTWAGASIHDVAQVVAAAEQGGDEALTVAVVVKLTRIIMLAPIVMGVNVWARKTREIHPGAPTPPLLPLFVFGFLAMILIRTSGVLPDGIISGAKTVEGVLLAAALVGLGSGVRVRKLARLGTRPVILGLISWMVVAGVSYIGVLLTT